MSERVLLVKEKHGTDYHDERYESLSETIIQPYSDSSITAMDNGMGSIKKSEEGEEDVEDKEKEENEKDGTILKMCSHNSVLWRYALLAFLCMTGVGEFFCLDNPAALQDHLLVDLDISETMYMGLYSAMLWVTIVSSLIGGYLIDRLLGVRWSVIVFSFLLTVAQGLFAGSAMLHNYWSMYASRIFFGITSAPLSLATDKLTVKWFKSQDINMAMAFRTSIPHAGSYINMSIMEPIYTYIRSLGVTTICLGLTLLVGAAVCLMSFISAVIVSYLDYQGDRREVMAKIKPSEEEKISVKLSDIRKFPLSFWILTVIMNFTYLTIFPFIELGLVYYEIKYQQNPQNAGNINGLIYLLSAILMPVFGLVVDKVGRNMFWLLGSIVLSTLAHVIFAFECINPYIPTTILGLGYSMFTTIAWPLAAHMAGLKQLGTAYGIMNAMLGLSQAGGTYVAGYIVDTKGYLVLDVFFIACQTVSLILTVILFLIESCKDETQGEDQVRLVP